MNTKYYTFAHLLYAVDSRNPLYGSIPCYWDSALWSWFPSEMFQDELALVQQGAREISAEEAGSHAGILAKV